MILFGGAFAEVEEGLTAESGGRAVVQAIAQGALVPTKIRTLAIVIFILCFCARRFFIYIRFF